MVLLAIEWRNNLDTHILKKVNSPRTLRSLEKVGSGKNISMGVYNIGLSCVRYLCRPPASSGLHQDASPYCKPPE
jgi:hypothetical protein